MHRLTILACLLIMVVSLPAVVSEVASLRGFLYGSEANCVYDNWVSHVSEGQVSNLNVYAPWDEQNNDFGDYRIPTTTDLQKWESVFADFLALDLDAAQQKLDDYEFPFEVVQFQDLDSGRNLYMLRETLNDDVDNNGTELPDDDETGSFDFGWGLYIYNPAASRPIVITAPHPCDDYPSPIFALKAFTELDARFLFINGAGREVAYFEPYNSNNQSISDPSRCPEHVFNVAYQRSADQIRGLTGKTEFSLQIHSYDWNKYLGNPNVMLSAGNEREYPALPIRDDSRSRRDLIHHTPWLVHPVNSIGANSEVEITDFYSVYYNVEYPVWYHDATHEVQVPRNRTLPGALLNQQMLYTEIQNEYDVYSPFLHVEMDELPKCYELDESNWRWFYGYEAETQTWNRAERYTKFLEFYTPWLSALDTVIDSMLILDDATGPSNPTNLRITDLYNNYLDFSWDRSYSYDFDTYEIHLRYEAYNGIISQTFDRSTNPELAWQNTNSFTLDLGGETRIYYLSILARDKHGNSSAYSNEVKVWKIWSQFTEFTATPGDNMIDLSFSTPSACLGFNIYRSEGYSDFYRISSWSNNPALLYNGMGVYNFVDLDVSNGNIYRYQVSAEYSAGSEIIYWEVITASPYKSYSMTLTNIPNAQSRSMYIGLSPLAADGLDDFDVPLENDTTPLVLCTDLDIEDEYYSQDVRTPFDSSTHEKTWNIRYRCSSLNTTLSFTPDPALIMEGAELLLYDVELNFWHDLRTGPYMWLNSNTSWKNLQLHWGYQLPFAQITYSADQYQYLCSALNLQWKVVNLPRVSSVDLYLCSVEDSLLIGSDLPTQQTQLDYTPTQSLSGARLLVLLHHSDGTSSHHYSGQRFNIVPENAVYQQEPGYSLVSFPVPGFSQSVSELLGNSASAYILDANSVWQPSQNLAYGNGYLIKHPQAFQLNLPSTLPVSPISLQLHPGWNLLPNPLNLTLELRNLVFSHNGIAKDYARMVAEGLLLPRVYLHDFDGFNLSNELPPCQSALLNYQGTIPISVTFNPGFHEGTPMNWDDQWSVSLSVSDGFNSGDAVQFGTADQSSPGLDSLYDLTKLPEIPGTLYRLALWHTDPQSGESIELQSEYKGLYPYYDQAEKVWQYHLNVFDMRPLRFKTNHSELPDGYSLELIINGISYYPESGEALWFDPSHTGLHTGYIRIRSYTPAQFANLRKAAVNIYPNPFREQVSIELPALKGEHLSVDIYNLRGQKVRSILKGSYLSGSTNLRWDGCDELGSPVSSGIYFLKIESKQESITKRLIKF